MVDLPRPRPAANALRGMTAKVAGTIELVVPTVD